MPLLFCMQQSQVSSHHNPSTLWQMKYNLYQSIKKLDKPGDIAGFKYTSPGSEERCKNTRINATFCHHFTINT